MRRLIGLSAFILTAALLAALVVPLFGGSTALANGPADHTLPPDDVDVDTNPCTGLVTTITISWTKFVLHETLDASGGGHFTVTGVATITTADGFSGRLTFWAGGNFNGGGSEETFTQSATLRNGSGSVVVARGVFHITEKDGVPVVEFDRESLECLGKPI